MYGFCANKAHACQPMNECEKNGIISIGRSSSYIDVLIAASCVVLRPFLAIMTESLTVRGNSFCNSPSRPSSSSVKYSPSFCNKSSGEVLTVSSDGLYKISVFLLCKLSRKVGFLIRFIYHSPVEFILTAGAIKFNDKYYQHLLVGYSGR